MGRRHHIHHHDLHDDAAGDHGRRHRGPHGHGRRRARRGAVGNAILGLLDEQPMHGYELINALEEKSGGRWKPSPGSIYPALQRLEHRGFIASTDDGEKRRFELTDAGRDRLADHRAAGNEQPWDDHGLGRTGELRRAVAEFIGPARQIGRFGTIDQVAAAVEVVTSATASLYRILADGAPSDGSDGTGTDATGTGTDTVTGSDGTDTGAGAGSDTDEPATGDADQQD